MCDTMSSHPAVERIPRSGGRKLSPVRCSSDGTSSKLSPKQMRTNSFSKKGAAKLIKSFSFNLKNSKRSLTPMRRTPSEVSTDNSVTSSDPETSTSRELEPTKSVHFNRNANSRKVKKTVYEFPKVTEEEARDYWYNEVDMMDMMEDVKHTVKQYLKKCERYRVAMDKIADKCASADEDRDSITAKLDPQVLLQISDAAARGVEHHVSPRPMFTREDIMQEVLRLQDHSGSDENAQLMATKYAELCKTARLIAKTLGDGDALVAEKIRASDSQKTTNNSNNKPAVVPKVVAAVEVEA
jgi:hypothetical protein